MKRWHLTVGLAASAIVAAAIAPKLKAMLLTPQQVAPPENPVIEEVISEVTEPIREEKEPQGPLVVTAGLDRTAVLKGSGSERFLTIQIEAPAEQGRSQRMPVNVAVVMDASGSMAARGKIDYAKRAAKTVVRGMQAGDAYSLVTFNDDAHVVVPASDVVDTDRLLRQIDRVYEGGGTNLYAGMSRGQKQIEQVLDSGEVGRLIILSDGKANVGVTDGDTLSRFAATAASKGIAVSAMGLGLDYNEDLLARIADVGGGTYDYIDDPSELESVFAAELDRTASVVAQHTALTVELPAGIEPIEVIGWDAQRTGNGWTLFMGDIHAGAKRKVIARVRVDGNTTGELEVARATATYTDLTHEQHGVMARSFDSAIASITLDPNQVASSLDPDAAAAANRAWGNRYLEMSTRAYEKGQREQALDYLRQGSTVLREAAVSTGSARLAEDAEQLDRQVDLYRGAAPKTTNGRRAIKMNKEMVRNAYR